MEIKSSHLHLKHGMIHLLSGAEYLFLACGKQTYSQGSLIHCQDYKKCLHCSFWLTLSSSYTVFQKNTIEKKTRPNNL